MTRYICIALLAVGVSMAPAASASAGQIDLASTLRSTGTPPQSAHASIIGGGSVPIGAYPWLAFIEAEEPDGAGFQCSGTVVAPRLVMTAGHCVENIETGTLTPASEYAVVTGASNLSSLEPRNVSLVNRAVVDPGFSPSTAHGDAGLLILSTPTAAPAVPLASASDNDLLRTGTPISVAGWGLTDPSAEGAPAELQAGTTHIHSSAYCRQHVAAYYPFFSSATQLCAIDSPSFAVGTCHGDSGGPAIAGRADGTPVEVGITSLVSGKGCSTSAPDVFTRVDRVSRWVASWIAAVEGGTQTPSAKAPEAILPLLTLSRAKLYSSKGLGEGFRYRYRRGSSKRIGCERVEREKVKCGVSWSQGGNDYYGTITIFYSVQRELITWRDRYKIHWVDDHCWFDSGHRQTCVIRTRIH